MNQQVFRTLSNPPCKFTIINSKEVTIQIQTSEVGEDVSTFLEVRRATFFLNHCAMILLNLVGIMPKREAVIILRYDAHTTWRI